MKDVDYLASAARSVSKATQALAAARSARRNEINASKRATAHARDARAALAVVQAVGQHTQELVHRQIARVVTRCLKAVYGKDAYEFRIRFERKRGKTDAVLEFVEDGKVMDPLGESAGGQVDVAAFALRLACLLLVRPRLRKLLVLDEPFKHVNGEEYQGRVGGMLLDLAKEMKVQFVIVTDDDWLRIGKVVQL